MLHGIKFHLGVRMWQILIMERVKSLRGFSFFLVVE
jgi:hypothetical protein